MHLFKFVKLIHILHFPLNFFIFYFLFYHDDVCKPFWIVDFTNKTCCEELVYFLHYYFVLPWCRYLSSSLDGLLGWVNIQAVFNESSINTVRVFMVSRQRRLNFLLWFQRRLELSTNLCDLLWATFNQFHIESFLHNLRFFNGHL